MDVTSFNLLFLFFFFRFENYEISITDEETSRYRILHELRRFCRSVHIDAGGGDEWCDPATSPRQSSPCTVSAPDRG